MKDIRAKNALVTGAASGIGRAIALALARRGADLLLVDVNGEGLDDVAREARALGVNVATAVCDLAKTGEVGALAARIRSDGGRLHILVNNAGLAYYGPTMAMSEEQWNQIMAVNLLAPIQLTRELLPLLMREDDAHLINVCSVFGLVTRRKIAAYQTSKFGLVGFTLALRAECASPHLGVTAICPGFVRTPLIDTLGVDGQNGTRREIPAFVCTTPEHVADKVIAALRSRKGIVVVTPLARLFWWAMRLSPSLVEWVARQGWKPRRRKLH